MPDSGQSFFCLTRLQHKNMFNAVICCVYISLLMFFDREQQVPAIRSQHFKDLQYLIQMDGQEFFLSVSRGVKLCCEVKPPFQYHQHDTEKTCYYF